MKIWTVTVVGDGETFSAWITEALAFADAEKLAIRMCAREAARTDTQETQWSKCVDRYILERWEHRDLMNKPMWNLFKSINITGIEVQGDAVTELAKLAT